jgi:hypothetical protein
VIQQHAEQMNRVTRANERLARPARQREPQ